MNAIISKFILTTGALATLVAVLPLAASAGEVHNRVERQQGRINRGVRSGQLTQGEYARDENRLRHINGQRIHDLRQNGGYLTGGERAHLNRELNRNSETIYFTKHNRARQPGAPLR